MSPDLRIKMLISFLDSSIDQFEKLIKTRIPTPFRNMTQSRESFDASKRPCSYPLCEEQATFWCPKYKVAKYCSSGCQDAHQPLHHSYCSTSRDPPEVVVALPHDEYVDTLKRLRAEEDHVMCQGSNEIGTGNGEALILKPHAQTIFERASEKPVYDQAIIMANARGDLTHQTNWGRLTAQFGDPDMTCGSLALFVNKTTGEAVVIETHSDTILVREKCQIKVRGPNKMIKCKNERFPFIFKCPSN